MIEVLGIEEPKKKNEITPELALSAARIIRDFCLNRDSCKGCCLVETNVCFDESADCWEIPEREV